MTSTSLPAIVPILNVPGGRGAWGARLRSGHVATLADRPLPGGRVGGTVGAPLPCGMGSMSAAPIDRKVRGALSPSRAGDFLSCPLLFRYRTIDRLPEGSSPDAVRGTLVHQVLEDIFDLPAAERTPARGARACSSPPGRGCRTTPGRLARSPPTVDEPAWLDSAHTVLDRWFTLEDPTRLEPAEREAYVEATLDSGLLLRGIVDRLDEAPDGALRVVDYKTGQSPSPRGSRQARCSSCGSTP